MSSEDYLGMEVLTRGKGGRRRDGGFIKKIFRLGSCRVESNFRKPSRDMLGLGRGMSRASRERLGLGRWVEA